MNQFLMCRKISRIWQCVTFPADEWIDSHADIVAAAGGDKAAALQRTAANGRKVWE